MERIRTNEGALSKAKAAGERAQTNYENEVEMHTACNKRLQGALALLYVSGVT